LGKRYKPQEKRREHEGCRNGVKFIGGGGESGEQMGVIRPEPGGHDINRETRHPKGETV